MVRLLKINGKTQKLAGRVVVGAKRVFSRTQPADTDEAVHYARATRASYARALSAAEEPAAVLN